MMVCKKGASLLWGVILCTVLFVISATIANSIMKESKTSIRMDDSARAYSAAQSGIEWGKSYYSDKVVIDPILHVEICPVLSPTVFKINYNNGIEPNETVTYTVEIKDNGTDCVISSLGSSKTTNRKIEYKFNENGLQNSIFDSYYLANLANFINPIKKLKVSGSYVQQFYLWQTNIVGTEEIGLGSTLNSRAIKVVYNSQPISSSIKLVVNDGSVDISSTPISLPVSALKLNEPYSLLVRIEYLRGTAVRLTVYSTNSGKFCVNSGSVIIPVEGRNFSSLNKFVFAPTAPANPQKVIDDTIGDGEAYKISNSSNTLLYLDNLAVEGIEIP